MTKLNWERRNKPNRSWVNPQDEFRKGHTLFTIYDCKQPGFIHRYEDGFDLFHWDKKVGHAKTIKKLKEQAEEIYGGFA